LPEILFLLAGFRTQYCAIPNPILGNLFPKANTPPILDFGFWILDLLPGPALVGVWPATKAFVKPELNLAQNSLSIF
jgi:hypothetical protein